LINYEGYLISLRQHSIQRNIAASQNENSTSVSTLSEDKWGQFMEDDAQQSCIMNAIDICYFPLQKAHSPLLSTSDRKVVAYATFGNLQDIKIVAKF